MRFSIIIPTYNRAQFLPKAIESCLRQEYSNFELIVVDDGSTDDTQAVVDRYTDPRIVYIHTHNVERGAARNLGILKSTGDYVTFLDSDDIYYPDYLQVAKAFIINNHYPKFFHQAFEIVDEQGLVLQKKISPKPEDILLGNYLACMGVFLKSEIAKTNLFNENRILAGSEDYELWLRIYAQHGILISDKVCSIMISHTKRSELNIKCDKLQERVRYLIETVENSAILRHHLGRKIRLVIANVYFYEAINLLIILERRKSLSSFIKALKMHRQSFINRKAYAYIYNFIKIGIFGKPTLFN